MLGISKQSPDDLVIGPTLMFDQTEESADACASATLAACSTLGVALTSRSHVVAPSMV